MATLLHNIHPGMQKSIVEAKDRIEKKVAHQTEKSIHTVHQRLVAFELRVRACPSSTINLMIFRKLWRVYGLMLMLS